MVVGGSKPADWEREKREATSPRTAGQGRPRSPRVGVAAQEASGGTWSPATRHQDVRARGRGPMSGRPWLVGTAEPSSGMHRGETRLAGDSERTTSASSSRRLPVPRLLLFDPREKHTVLSSTVLPALSSSLALRTPSERVLRPGEACLISSGEGREASRGRQGLQGRATAGTAGTGARACDGMATRRVERTW